MVSRRSLWILNFSCYCMYAAIATAIGPVLPNISNEFNLTPDMAGAIASLYSLGGVMAFLGGWVSDRFGRGLVASSSLIIMGISSLLMIVSPSVYLLSIALLIVGIGGGFFEAASNAMVSDLYVEKRGMAINLLHVAWNVGSGFGPPLISIIILFTGNWRLSYLALLPLSFPLAILLYILAKNVEINHRDKPRDTLMNILRGFLTMLPLTSIAVFIIAVELGISSWLPSIFINVGASLIEGGLAVGLFWGLMGVGRLVWAPFIDKLGYQKSLLSSSLAGVISMSIAASPIYIYLKILFWAISGLFLAPLYPTLIAWITALNPRSGGAYTGILFTFGTIGSFISTWLTGVIIKILGAETAQYFFPILGIVIILNILVARIKLSR